MGKIEAEFTQENRARLAASPLAKINPGIVDDPTPQKLIKAMRLLAAQSAGIAIDHLELEDVPDDGET